MRTFALLFVVLHALAQPAASSAAQTAAQPVAPPAAQRYGLQTVHDPAAYRASIRQDPRQQLVPLNGLALDIRYATSENLLHRPVYTMAAAYLRLPAANALFAVETELRSKGLGLKVFDGYRPYAATVAFYEAYHDTNYVASPYSGSRHNRGCAVDLTLIDLKTGRDLPMPTPFDDFTIKASATYTDLPADVIANRTLLQDVMQRHGFLIYPHEWWHFDYAGWRDFPVTDIPFEALAAPANSAAGASMSAPFNIRDYGATGDGIHLDHTAINRAIDACAAAGGGTVYVPAGIYLSGSIHLKSHIHLLLDAGSVIKGAPDSLHAYDPAEPFPDSIYQDGGHTYFHNSLIWGEHLTDVSITGMGRIDGGGLTARDHEVQDHREQGPMPTGDKAIALKWCSNILIRDITIFHGGHFAILFTGCDLVTLDNLTIDTNRDGIDLDACTNTLVTKCRVNSPNDDAICPKSSFALGRARITENLIITDCQVSAFKEGSLISGECITTGTGFANGRIKFGTESNGGFRNCVVSNCTFRHCNGFALEEVDGGIMDNIVVSNLSMMDIIHYPIYITLGQRNRGPAATTRTGTVDHIYIRDVAVTGADSLSGIQITGSPGHVMTHIQLQNITVEYRGGGTREQGVRAFPELARRYPEPSSLGVCPAYGLFARHVTGLLLDNVTFTTLRPEGRPALICQDVRALRVSHFDAPMVAGVPVYRFTDVPGPWVEGSCFSVK